MLPFSCDEDPPFFTGACGPDSIRQALASLHISTASFVPLSETL